VIVHQCRHLVPRVDRRSCLTSAQDIRP
jgi:hypothetical protein